MSEEKLLYWHGGRDTERYLGSRLHRKGGVLWLTGLSGSGKSTLGLALEQAVLERGVAIFRLDGDNVRHGLNGDLGFSLEDRHENVRRLAHVAALMADAGLLVVVAAISPLRAMRREAAELVGEGRFLEVWVRASLDACAGRDPKGLYARARSGGLQGFTGLDQAYEPPENPAAVLDTEALGVEEGVSRLLSLLGVWWEQPPALAGSAGQGPLGSERDGESQQGE